MLFYLEDHGIHDGVVWECAVNLSESAHKSPNLQACLIATQCILAGLSVAEAPLELPYTVCGLIVDSDWGFDRLHGGMMQMLSPPGHHAGGNGDAQPCC